MLPLAHPGHWVVDAIYFVPVVAFLGWLAYSELRSRRERRRTGGDGAAGRPQAGLDD